MSLLKNIIPQEWSNIWDGPEVPNSYLKSLGKKIKGMNNYLKNVDGDNILKNCDINLSEFLHPEAFINALRQKTAREKKRINEVKKNYISPYSKKIIENNLII